MAKQVIYVSATPADYELVQSEGIIVEQVIRPTGLLDPVIEVRPSLNQIDDLMEEIQIRIEKEERTLVTTLTKRMAEELTEYLLNNNVRCNYIHSDVDTLERVKIMDDLRQGVYDVLIGVNLLREGLDLPEVSLVAILDADKGLNSGPAWMVVSNKEQMAERIRKERAVEFAGEGLRFSDLRRWGYEIAHKTLNNVDAVNIYGAPCRAALPDR